MEWQESNVISVPAYAIIRVRTGHASRSKETCLVRRWHPVLIVIADRELGYSVATECKMSRVNWKQELFRVRNTKTNKGIYKSLIISHI